MANRRTPALDGNRPGDVECRGGEQVCRGVLDQVDWRKDVRIGPGALDDDRQRPQDEEQAEEAEDGRARDAAGPREHQQTQPGGQDRGDAVSGDLEQLGQLVPPLRLRRAAAMDDTPRRPLPQPRRPAFEGRQPSTALDGTVDCAGILLVGQRPSVAQGLELRDLVRDRAFVEEMAEVAREKQEPKSRRRMPR